MQILKIIMYKQNSGKSQHNTRIGKKKSPATALSDSEFPMEQLILTMSS